jgi:hypothetical protein
MCRFWAVPKDRTRQQWFPTICLSMQRAVGFSTRNTQRKAGRRRSTGRAAVMCAPHLFVLFSFVSKAGRQHAHALTLWYPVGFRRRPGIYHRTGYPLRSLTRTTGLCQSQQSRTFHATMRGADVMTSVRRARRLLVLADLVNFFLSRDACSFVLLL